jgi:flavodoxin
MRTITSGGEATSTERRRLPAAVAAVVITFVLLCGLLSCGSSSVASDAVSGATSAVMDPAADRVSGRSGVLIILAGSRYGGTARIADAIAGMLDATVVSPAQVKPEELAGYDLIGFGSGIFDQKHHRSLLDAVDRLPQLAGKRVFIFSTSGVSRQYAMDHGIDDPHTPLRDKLRVVGCTVVGEYNCAGFNDNSFLKLFGGMNKGRPNDEDIRRAVEFAQVLGRGRPESE